MHPTEGTYFTAQDLLLDFAEWQERKEKAVGKGHHWRVLSHKENIASLLPVVTTEKWKRDQ